MEEKFRDWNPKVNMRVSYTDSNGNAGVWEKLQWSHGLATMETC